MLMLLQKTEIIVSVYPRTLNCLRQQKTVSECYDILNYMAYLAMQWNSIRINDKQ